MVLTQLLFTKSKALPTHNAIRDPGKKEGRKNTSFVKATSNPGMQLAGLSLPPLPSTTSREGKASTKGPA